jgi:hypothetical protein
VFADATSLHLGGLMEEVSARPSCGTRSDTRTGKFSLWTTRQVVRPLYAHGVHALPFDAESKQDVPARMQMGTDKTAR